MGAAESSEPPEGGGTGIAAQILRLKMAKSKGEISEEQLEAGAHSMQPSLFVSDTNERAPLRAPVRTPCTEYLSVLASLREQRRGRIGQRRRDT